MGTAEHSSSSNSPTPGPATPGPATPGPDAGTAARSAVGHPIGSGAPVPPVRVGDGHTFVDIGPNAPLTIIAGPCVLEAPEITTRIAETLVACCASLGLGLILKGSFDKANRSSIRSPRGPGIESGLDQLASLRERFRVPVTTDIHEAAHAERAARSVDLLQIPAFLCRQTDLLVAAGATGRPVNVKKGQFMSPAEMENVAAKLRDGGAPGVVLTERGTFFGYNRLVNDFIGIGDLMELGCPVCFDATHSTQLPGGERTSSGGRPERAPLLARAAVAAGVHAVFLECHPKPSAALSDASTMLDLAIVPELLSDLAAIRRALRPRHDDATQTGRAGVAGATVNQSS